MVLASPLLSPKHATRTRTGVKVSAKSRPLFGCESDDVSIDAAAAAHIAPHTNVKRHPDAVLHRTSQVDVVAQCMLRRSSPLDYSRFSNSIRAPGFQFKSAPSLQDHD